MNKRVHILIADPSSIIRRGLISIFMEIKRVGVDVAELANIAKITDEIATIKPDIVIINPLHLGITLPKDLVPKGFSPLIIALHSHIMSVKHIDGYDGVISMMDEDEEIEQTIEKLLGTKPNLAEEELSARERDVVKAIALGRSNKEIADELCISTHTVMTHRKNIANKLKIHNPAGLTIYAIVNKIIDIGEVK